MKYRFIQSPTLSLLLFSSVWYQPIIAQNYSLYSIASRGGAYGDGVVYRYEYPSGKDTVILNFNGINGRNPSNYLILASDRDLYSTTTNGGTSSSGVLYRINPITYQDSVLVNFNQRKGAHPKGGLIQASNEILYGATSAGGTYNLGVFYSYNIITKTQTVLFSFSGINGSTPSGHLIQASNGLLYGHTINGGLYGFGVLFSYNIITGKDSVVINFNGMNGSAPRGFMQATNGLIYGTTCFGGTANTGVLYSYDPVSGTQNVLMNFTGPNGVFPSGDATSLFETSAGLLYGITQMGGTYNNGVLYSYNMNTGFDSILISFSPAGILGEAPDGSGYMQLPGGELIIPIDSGGLYGLGTLLSYNPVTGVFKKLMDFNDTNGAFPFTDMVTIINISEDIGNTLNKGKINLYPDPNNGLFSLSVYGYGNNNEIQIYNMTGEMVYRDIFTDKTQINLKQYPDGIYLYRVLSADGNMVTSGKFIMQ